MKLTYEQILAAWDSMSKVIKGEVLDKTTRYGILRAFPKLEEAVKPLIPLKEELIKEYNVVEPKTGIVIKRKDTCTQEEWKKIWNEFLDTEAEVEIYELDKDGVNEIKLLLSDGKLIPLPLQDMHNLRFWFKEMKNTKSTLPECRK